MARPIVLFTGPWADLPLATLVVQAAGWGYSGLELCCWGDHLEVQRGLQDEDYCARLLDLLARHELHLAAIANHKVGQAVCDTIDERHQALLPEHVWGDGQPPGVRQRAAEEMMATFRLAERLGVTVVTGFTGSPIWRYVAGYPALTPQLLEQALQQFAQSWHPILDVARDCGVRFACEVHPGQLAFDLYSAELVLEALDNREEFGFTLDPSHLHWQGVDPIEFVRRFADRIYHVHVKDAVLTLDGRAGILSGYWPSGDRRAGWQFRSPGHGGIDWPNLLRALNEIGYDGPLSVDWHDPGMDRDYGAADAVRFLQSIEIEPPPRSPRLFRP
jgi:sugar phosphate isomerase/epimerase